MAHGHCLDNHPRVIMAYMHNNQYWKLELLNKKAHSVTYFQLIDSKAATYKRCIICIKYTITLVTAFQLYSKKCSLHNINHSCIMSKRSIWFQKKNSKNCTDFSHTTKLMHILIPWKSLTCHLKSGLLTSCSKTME